METYSTSEAKWIGGEDVVQKQAAQRDPAGAFRASCGREGPRRDGDTGRDERHRRFVGHVLGRGFPVWEALCFFVRVSHKTRKGDVYRNVRKCRIHVLCPGKALAWSWYRGTGGP